MPRPVRVAAIDIGSNAVRLCIADVAGRSMTVVAEDRVPTQLARGLDTSGRLHAKAIAPTVAAAGAFLALARKLKAARSRIVATAAVREAADGPAFVRKAESRLKHTVEVLTPEEEGAIAFLSLSQRFDLSKRPAAVIDIGGGSAQVVLSHLGAPIRVISMPLGAVRLTDMFGGPGSAAGPRAKALRAHIERTLADSFDRIEHPPATILGTGGTVTTIATLANHPRGRIHRDDIHRVLKAYLSAAPELPALASLFTADRAGIAFAGLAVLGRILTRFHSDTLHAHAGGVREGLCWALAEKPPRSAIAGVRGYAERVRYERPHSEQVARLSLSLFDRLAATTPLKRALAHEPRARLLLEAAAVLHDIGVRVGYDEHHKHGRDMILCSRLHGFTARELSILAQIVRYHRKQEPSLEHTRFAGTPPRDRQLIEVLSALLRLGDALDRSHKQPLRSLKVTAQRGLIRVRLRLKDRAHVHEEFRAAKAKGKLLERLWKSRVELELAH